MVVCFIDLNIVVVYDVQQVGDLVFIVMEFIEGYLFDEYICMYGVWFENECVCVGVVVVCVFVVVYCYGVVY